MPSIKLTFEPVTDRILNGHNYHLPRLGKFNADEYAEHFGLRAADITPQDVAEVNAAARHLPRHDYLLVTHEVTIG